MLFLETAQTSVLKRKFKQNIKNINFQWMRVGLLWERMITHRIVFLRDSERIILHSCVSSDVLCIAIAYGMLLQKYEAIYSSTIYSYGIDMQRNELCPVTDMLECIVET